MQFLICITCWQEYKPHRMSERRWLIGQKRRTLQSSQWVQTAHCSLCRNEVGCLCLLAQIVLALQLVRMAFSPFTIASISLSHREIRENGSLFWSSAEQNIPHVFCCGVFLFTDTFIKKCYDWMYYHLIGAYTAWLNVSYISNNPLLTLINHLQCRMSAIEF